MSNGCLLFAFNNSTIDYIKLANASASNIKRHLSLPTTLVTDSNVDFNHDFDQIIVVDKPNHGYRHFADYNKKVKWFNYGRHLAYGLSPYNRTLLLDVDYIVSSSQLKMLFDLDNDFLCHRTSTDITGKCFKSSNFFGLYNMPMFWATVVYFTKTEISKCIFDTMKMVQDNYPHYANLYNFKHHPFRNDYALSIALNINSGHCVNSNEYDIPWDLMAVMPENQITRVKDDSYEIVYPQLTSNRTHDVRVIVQDKDLHVMGKKYLEDIYEN